jgi:hypothetical protein
VSDFLILEILSVILLAAVLIHFTLIPTFEPSKSLEKNLARVCPMMDFLQV